MFVPLMAQLTVTKISICRAAAYGTAGVMLSSKWMA